MTITLSQGCGCQPKTSCNHTCNESNSVLGSINTGFGPEFVLTPQSNCCQKPGLYLHLYKETYLSEFETESEKKQARLNLGVLSAKEVSDQINLKLADYVTKQDVDNIVAGSLNLQNYYTKSEMDVKLSNIKLNLDRKPTKGSMNGVTSDGVWQHVDDTVGAIHRYTNTI